MCLDSLENPQHHPQPEGYEMGTGYGGTHDRRKAKEQNFGRVSIFGGQSKRRCVSVRGVKIFEMLQKKPRCSNIFQIKKIINDWIAYS